MNVVFIIIPPPPFYKLRNSIFATRGHPDYIYGEHFAPVLQYSIRNQVESAYPRIVMQYMEPLKGYSRFGNHFLYLFFFAYIYLNAVHCTAYGTFMTSGTLSSLLATVTFAPYFITIFTEAFPIPEVAPLRWKF